MRQWHELDQETHERLRRPLNDAELERILRAVYGEHLRPLAENVEVWCDGAKRKGLCWWPFDALTADGQKVTLGLFFWDLELSISYKDLELLGEREYDALGARLDELAREWGVEREQGATVPLSELRFQPGPRRRPSALARLLPV